MDYGSYKPKCLRCGEHDGDNIYIEKREVRGGIISIVYCSICEHTLGVFPEAAKIERSMFHYEASTGEAE